jgi:peptidoglycan/LPS O-acetylase OafA/YrhL
MPVLVHFKHRIARQLGSGALEAEARQPRICAYLSAILLAGLGLNAWLGWWWADPVAGLLMVPLICKPEGASRRPRIFHIQAGHHPGGEDGCTMSQDRQSGRIIQLDFLRGIAILLVLGRHPVVNPRAAGHMYPLAGLRGRFGWTGVDLFFALSGFLVGGLLFRELIVSSKLDVVRFIVRRGFKIWPGYFVFLVFLLLTAGTRADPSTSATDFLPNFLHVQNYLLTPSEHTWSLAVEEHFYLALPLTLLWLTHIDSAIRLRTMVGITGLLLASCLVLRLGACRPGFDFSHILYPTHLRIDSLFVGVTVSYLYHSWPALVERLRNHRSLLLLIGFLLISPAAAVAVEHSTFMLTFGLTMLSVGYGLIVIALATMPHQENRSGIFYLPIRVVTWIGFYSYTTYLWHINIAAIPVNSLLHHGLLAFAIPEARWFIATLVYVAVATTAGFLLSRLVEMPMLRLRDRVYPSRVPGSAHTLTIEDRRPTPHAATSSR